MDQLSYSELTDSRHISHPENPENYAFCPTTPPTIQKWVVATNRLESRKRLLRSNQGLLRIILKQLGSSMSIVRLYPRELEGQLSRRVKKQTLYIDSAL
jgi:hypothetical protein